jgi:hypothetical protein
MVNRRIFIRNSSLAAAGAMLLPSWLKAATTQRDTAHVVIVILSGGIRLKEAQLHMPNIFNGSTKPRVLKKPLQTNGTLLANFAYHGNEISHLPARNAILNGSYTDFELMAEPWKNKLSPVYLHEQDGNHSSLLNLFNHSIRYDHPKTVVIETSGADAAHYNYSAYCKSLEQQDEFIARLWLSIQSCTHMQDNTVLMVLPDHGRNNDHNELADDNGFYGLDHYHEAARYSFCLFAGPSRWIKQNHVSHAPAESIDVLPTLAYTQNNTAINHSLKGRVMHQVFS